MGLGSNVAFSFSEPVTRDDGLFVREACQPQDSVKGRHERRSGPRSCWQGGKRRLGPDVTGKRGLRGHPSAETPGQRLARSRQAIV